MIPLEKQVSSFALSKRLKELGVKQESAFCWFEYKWPNNPSTWPGNKKPQNEWRLSFGPPAGLYEDGVWKYGKKVAAFTVAELGEMLPPDTPSEKGFCWTMDSEDGDTWHYERADEMGIDFEPHSERADNEAEARALMLAHLIEKGIVKP